MAEAAHGSQTRYWILLIVGATIAPLVLVSVVILHQFYQAHQDRATSHLEELVAKHKQNIDGFLDAKLGDIRMLAGSFSFEELRQEEFLQERLRDLQRPLDRFVDRQRSPHQTLRQVFAVDQLQRQETDARLP